MQDSAFLKIDHSLRKRLDAETYSGFYRCWTCGACDGACPINISRAGLRPLKIVRMAYIGALDGLLSTPEIWYCLTCRRCGQCCPNQVKPYEIIRYARKEMIRQGRVTLATIRRYETFFAMFQRVRWHAVAQCFHGSLTTLSEADWNQWLNTPIPMSAGKITMNGRTLSGTPRWDTLNTDPHLCFTCSECSSACPIIFERSLFDPQAIVRMVNLNMTEELLTSPSIWLCIGCERCAEACSQTVKAHEIIKQLQRLAKSENIVDDAFEMRIRQSEKIIYHRFFKEIDHIFNLPKIEPAPSHLGNPFTEPVPRFAAASLSTPMPA